MSVELILFILVLVIWSNTLTWRSKAKYETWKRKRVFAHGRQAEPIAERLLVVNDYEIVEKQCSRDVEIIVDGRMQCVTLRPDFIVRSRRSSELFVADCKTGKCATWESIETRRQLLEYFLVFKCDAVLLVDPDNKKITRIEFDKLCLRFGNQATS